MVELSFTNYLQKTAAPSSVHSNFVNNTPNASGSAYSYSPILIKEDTFESPSKLRTDAVYTTWTNPTAGNVTGVPLTLVHLNDNHRKVKGLMRFKTAFDNITKKIACNGSDLLKIHSGDFNVGNDSKKFSFQVELLNRLGIDYSTIGNHEFDIGSAMVAARKLSNAMFTMVAANMVIPANSGFDALVRQGKVVNSVIHKTNNAEYGIIGIAPPDIKERADRSVKFYGIEVLPPEQTIKAIQDEINKLTKHGINKIILVSHGGINLDKRIAAETDGLDVILGGHSHVLLDPLEEQESIIYSNKSQKPVLVLQDGQNGQFCGVTDINFDAEGVVKTAIARQERATNFEASPDIKELEDEILGKSPMIGVSSSHYRADDVKLRENVLGNLVADAFRDHTGAQVAIYPSPDIRGSIEKGLITERDISDLLPFVDCTYVISLSGEDLIQALNNGAHSYSRADKRPGILQVSGVKYTITPDGEAADVMV
ncbi:MAG: bifunctional UDP-sugar hydrolase/5'-nucleotidase, partial [Vampirovibrionia bacterium]